MVNTCRRSNASMFLNRGMKSNGEQAACQTIPLIDEVSSDSVAVAAVLLFYECH